MQYALTDVELLYMEIIDEIVKWAANQPLWQQALVAELLSGGELNEKRYRFYADQAVEEATDPEAYSEKIGNPLEEYEYSGETSAGGVRISEVEARQNINAIPDGSKLPIEKVGLNMIYGNNASGKSGYTRILKNSCNCRHSEQLRGNVHGEHERECIANILYDVDGNSHNFQLDNNNDTNPHLKTVHVFDSKSGHNYLISENDLVFMPAGMDILDSLSGAIEIIAQRLKDDLQAKTGALNDLETSFAEFAGTKAYDLVGSLSGKTASDDLKAQKVLTLDEQQEIITLEKDTVLRQTKSPQKIRDERTTLHTRLNGLLTQLNTLQDALNQDNVDKIIAARDDAAAKRKTADEAGKKKFENENFISGTGNDLWKDLWEAAQEFSNKSVYPEHTFPHTGEQAKCVLCQQPILEPAADRFTDFLDFVNDKSQALAISAEAVLKNLKDTFIRANLLDDTYNNLLINFSEDDYKDITKLSDEIKTARDAHQAYIAVFNGSKKIEGYADLKKFEAELAKFVEFMTTLAEEIKTPLDDDEFRRQLQTDLDKLKNLKSKKALNTYEKQILENITIQVEKKILQDAIGLSKTFAVSTKIGDVSERLIIDNLAKTFNDELGEIFLGKITAKLVKGRTIKGVPSSAIILSGKSGDLKGDSIEKIMSEGEQRGVALAGFFAELSVNPSTSAIVFDDPVTSLDHLNVERIANRIAREALTRQVIVFTHNVLFASELERAVDELGGKYTARSIEKVSSPGVVRESLPFDTMKTGQRIDFLEKRINPIKTKFENNEPDYKSETESFYKDLRRTWERAIEEILLNGIVIRYRRDVKPGNVNDIFINDDDKKLIADNMHTCAKYMHDPADETGGTETPTPDNIKDDLQIIKDWVTDIKQRAKTAKAAKS
jgi:AAA domain-containing protein